jgi:HD-GYP domain-containing protein (c-di-GMP phosphodiesterase class II)
MRTAAQTQKLVHAYVASVAALGVIAFVLSCYVNPIAQPSGGIAGHAGLAVFVLIAFGLQIAEHRLTVGKATGSIAFIVYLASALVFGPTWCVLIVSGTVATAQLISHKEPIKILFNVSQHVIALVGGSFAYLALNGPIPPQALDTAVVPFFAFVLTSFTINGAAVSGVIAISESKRFVEVWMRNTWALAAYDLVASALGLGVAWLYVRFGLPGIAGVVVPILFLRHTFLINLQLQNTNRELLDLMVKAIEARDPYTCGHSQRVAKLAKVLAQESGIGFKEVENIATSALLHDVGKIYEEFAPLLRKEGALTDQERAVMNSHSSKSAELVGTISTLCGYVQSCVQAHHENYDGSGYPDGLSGESIPLGARIVMIADTTDAMTTDRPYRNALSYEQVLAELDRCSSKQFDPDLVRVFSQSTAIRAMVADWGRPSPLPVRFKRHRLGMRIAR